MKKLAFLLLVLAIAACNNTPANPENEVRDLAKKDIMEKLSLPEGTQFNDDDFVVTPLTTEDGELDTSYLVKVTVKSQDREGNDVIQTHTLLYEETGEDSKEYELATFKSE